MPFAYVVASVLALLLVCAAPATAAPLRAGTETVELWPANRMPGSASTEPESELPSQGDGVIRLTHVSRPTLEIYPAPGPAPAPAVIVCPGGGYARLAYNKEGTEVARWLNANGYAALVLKYRVPDNREGAFHDVRRALRLARARAADWRIDPARVGVLGFSAGGHLAARAAFGRVPDPYPEIDDADAASSRPDFAVLVYPAYLGGEAGVAPEFDLAGGGPPALLVHNEDDARFIAGTRRFASALDEAALPHVFLNYPTGGHGYGLRCDLAARVWPGQALDWLRRITPPPVAPATLPSPTYAGIPYGAHPRQTLDFWQAPGDGPSPLVLYFHGGGWVKDDGSRPDFARLLASGISVAAVRYRYTTEAQLAGVQPPVEWPMRDAARALQFVRALADAWHVDTGRIAVSGRSAGACTALWLALHDDFANPAATDPVARLSTRVYCAAVEVAQTTLDPAQMRDWTPNSRYGGHAFGLMDPLDLTSRDTRFADFLARRDELLPQIRTYSPIAHASPDDPPLSLHYEAAPAPGQPQADPTHSANFGVGLRDVLAPLGVPCELVYPGALDVVSPSVTDFLIARLRTAPIATLPHTASP